MRPRAVAIGAVAMAILATDARAQAGDRGPGEDVGAAPRFLPLQLTLTSTLVPLGQAFDGCRERGDPSGNSIQGFPIQHVTAFRLVPALTLHGFSSRGCPLDAAGGGGVTLAVPIRTDLSLVLSAGVVAQPPVQGLRPPVFSSGVGLDVVRRRLDGNLLWVGIGVVAPQSGLRLRAGGTF